MCRDWYRGFCDFFFQAEDGIRDLVRSRGLGDVYKRQVVICDPAEYATVAALAGQARGLYRSRIAVVPIGSLSLIHI